MVGAYCAPPVVPVRCTTLSAYSCSSSIAAAAGSERRKLDVKAACESNVLHFSFKRLVPGAFNVEMIGSTCTILPGRTGYRRPPGACAGRPDAMERRKSSLKAKFESSMSYCSFKCLVPGAVNMGFKGSTCTALPRGAAPAPAPRAVPHPCVVPISIKACHSEVRVYARYLARC
jgi:hypothetical protein